MDLVSAQGEHLDRLRERQDEVLQAVEKLQVDQREDQAQAQDRLAKFGASLGTETEKLVRKERELLNDQLRHAQQALSDEHQEKICNLERKLTEQIARECLQHESMVLTNPLSIPQPAAKWATAVTRSQTAHPCPGPMQQLSSDGNLCTGAGGEDLIV